MGSKNKNRKKYTHPTNGEPKPVELDVKTGMRKPAKEATNSKAKTAYQMQGVKVESATMESKKKQNKDACLASKYTPVNGNSNANNAAAKENGKETARAEKKRSKKRAKKRNANVMDEDSLGGSASDVSAKRDPTVDDGSPAKRSRKLDSDSSDTRNNNGKCSKSPIANDSSKKKNIVGKVASGAKVNPKAAHSAGKPSGEDPVPHKVPVLQCVGMEDGATSDSNTDSDEDDYIEQFFDEQPEAKEKKGSQSNKPRKRAKKAIAQNVSPGGWVVENNDCSLEYGPSSDEEPTGKPSAFRATESPKKVVAFKRKEPPAEAQEIDEDDDDDDDDYDTFDSDEDDSDWTDDDEDPEVTEFYDNIYDMSNESEYDDYLQKGYDSDSFDGNMNGADSYDDDYESSADECRSPRNSYSRFTSGQPYETDSDDEDYEPPEGDDTVYIPRGAAVLRDLDDDSIVHFDASGKYAQIVELPADYGMEKEGSDLDQSDKQGEGEQKERKSENVVQEEAEVVDDGAESDRSCSPLLEISPKPTTYTFYDAVDLRMSLVVLKAPLYIHGHLSVQALFGKVDIFGYQLDMAEKRTVFASGGYNALNLTPLPSPDTYSTATFERILNKLSRHFVEADMRELVREFNPADSALVLLRADSFDANDTVPMVCRLLPEFDLFPTALTLNQTSSPFRTTETLLEVAMFVPSQPTARSAVPQFQPNPVWDTVPVSANSRLMVVGGKSSGKSTLCQYLINRYIKQFGRVLLLDLDIGQPLLFVPETLSVSVLEEPILGVGCFANVQPRQCKLFGSLNVVSSPLVYVQNVRSLVQYCNEDPALQDIPWIINTMGYVVGFGKELTMAIVRLLQPTDLIQLSFPKNGKKSSTPFLKPENYANQLTAELVNGFNFNILREEVQLQSAPANYRFHPIDVVYEPNKTSFLPPKRRTIAMMAQLARILSDTAETFTDVKPHMAHLDDLSIISTGEDCTSKEMMKRALNGTLVYLCEKLAADQYNCFGVGIVRSVDEKENNVYLLHSLSSEQLAKTNVLAMGSTSLPSQVYLHCSPKIEGTIPYLQNMSIVQVQA
uniref:Polynucleotide 5'-hydroxyl-kinase NOL9 n=1 Tax=Anopheles coluzzii TaxID=1518534 RepID=A0A6E8VL62_ANOCL|nr:polynucleotide 5'-hydroxyl-kinase NOL9 [Anopheles coluzzii]XP_049462884.1 polynucleotide 5'-hydroxyl-kinase NOL9 [Anopheles coluzzii]